MRELDAKSLRTDINCLVAAPCDEKFDENLHPASFEKG
jgi:hypothetical protein